MMRRGLNTIWIGTLGALLATGCLGGGDWDDGEEWPGEFDVAGAEEPLLDNADEIAGDESVAAVGFHCVGTLERLDCTNESEPDYRYQIIGGQGRNIDLDSEEPDLDPTDLNEWAEEGGGTATAEVTVTNLMDVAMGTDGEGIDVFFVQEPVVIDGADDVTIEIQDGDGNPVERGSFDGSDQPFFTYDEDLGPNETSAPLDWRFEYSGIDETEDATAILYEFAVLVHAHVENPVALEFETARTGEPIDISIEMHDGFENSATWEAFDVDGTLVETYENTDEFPHDFGEEEGIKKFIVHLDDAAGPRVISWSQELLENDIPAELGELVGLERLVLSTNRFDGEIPAELGNMESLQDLRLPSNDFTGNIPAALQGLTSLEDVVMQNNDLEGYEAGAFKTQTELGEILLHGNQLDEEDLDQVIEDCHETRDERTNATLSLQGNQEEPSSAAIELAEELEEDHDWTICPPSDTC